MITSLSQENLKEYLGKQLDTYLPDKYRFTGKDIDVALSIAMDRVEECFKHITQAHYRNSKNEALFNHLHSDQYSQFLYFLSNTLWLEFENKPICDKIILLNKIMNGMFYSYKCKLPDHFLFAHPVGTIIGNADYSDCLVIFQNVTVNTYEGEENLLPKLGKGLFLGSGAKIIGHKTIGDRVSIGVDALVYNQEIESDCVVLKDSKSGCQIIRKRKKNVCMAQNYFDINL